MCLILVQTFRAEIFFIIYYALSRQKFCVCVCVLVWFLLFLILYLVL